MLHRFIVTVLAAVMTLAQPSLAPEAYAAPKKKERIARPASDAPMRVVIVESAEGCDKACPQWIYAEGEITPATPAKFAKIFRTMGKRKLPVLIHSPGGSIAAAMEIGKMIRERGLDVAVSSTRFTSCAPPDKTCKLPASRNGIYQGLTRSEMAYCNSACHLVLAAGTMRLAPAGSFVGVHQARTVWTREIITYRERYKIVKGKKHVIDRKVVSRKPGKSKVTYGYDKALRKTLLAYYKSMGVGAGLLDEAEKASFKDINFLNEAQLDSLKLRTRADGPLSLVGRQVCQRKPQPQNCVASPANAVTQ